LKKKLLEAKRETEELAEAKSGLEQDLNILAGIESEYVVSLFTHAPGLNHNPPPQIYV